MSLRDATVSVYTALRDDADVVAAVYPDQTPPASDERDRVYVGPGGAPNDRPVELAILPLARGASTNRSIVTRGYAFEVTAVATERWFESHGVLALLDIIDAATDVGVLAPAEGVVAEGTNGAEESRIETEQETGRRHIGQQFQFRESGTRY